MLKLCLIDSVAYAHTHVYIYTYRQRSEEIVVEYKVTVEHQELEDLVCYVQQNLLCIWCTRVLTDLIKPRMHTIVHPIANVVQRSCHRYVSVRLVAKSSWPIAVWKKFHNAHALPMRHGQQL